MVSIHFNHSEVIAFVFWSFCKLDADRVQYFVAKQITKKKFKAQPGMGTLITGMMMESVHSYVYIHVCIFGCTCRTA